MKKRFSIKAFLLVTLIHLVATSSLFMASERTYGKWAHPEGELRPSEEEFNSLWINSAWFEVTTWVLQPVALSISYYLRHHPGDFFDRPNPANYFLPWSVFVGVCFGFLTPRISRWRERRGNN